MEELITFGFGVLLTVSIFGIIFLLKKIKEVELELEDLQGEYEDLNDTFESFVSATERQVAQIYQDIKTLLDNPRNDG